MRQMINTANLNTMPEGKCVQSDFVYLQRYREPKFLRKILHCRDAREE